MINSNMYRVLTPPHTGYASYIPGGYVSVEYPSVIEHLSHILALPTSQPERSWFKDVCQNIECQFTTDETSQEEMLLLKDDC